MISWLFYLSKKFILKVSESITYRWSVGWSYRRSIMIFFNILVSAFFYTLNLQAALSKHFNIIPYHLNVSLEYSTHNIIKARSETECVLRCQRTVDRKVAFFTEHRKCYCFSDDVVASDGGASGITGKIFSKVFIQEYSFQVECDMLKFIIKLFKAFKLFLMGNPTMSAVTRFLVSYYPFQFENLALLIT